MLPEYIEPGGTTYVYRDREFWTSGFFPGSLYLLLERDRKYPHVIRQQPSANIPEMQLNFASRWWTDSLHQNARLTGTHDIGFMIMPWARRAWELNGDRRALDSITVAATTLSHRFSPTIGAAGAIRSWDVCTTQVYNFTDPDQEFLVIIDNMMNLDLLFYAAAQMGDRTIYDRAVAHARTTQAAHVRADGSTTHLVVFEPATGDVRARLTNQGFSNDSCWARGQAWAIAGFAETYHWTHDASFLATACKCADYFLARVTPLGWKVPWDFDAAELSGVRQQPPDTSAAMVAAYGLILLHQARSTLGEPSDYLVAALNLTGMVCRDHLNAPARFLQRTETLSTAEQGKVQHVVCLDVDVGKGGCEAILNGATINNFESAPRRWADHALVYADYFFLLVGNKLLELGLGHLLVEDLPSKNKNGVTNGFK